MMWISEFFIPVIMLMCGFFMYKFPPKKINGFIGYRTSRSRKNKDTWLFANRYCGKFWMTIGLVLSVPAVILAVLFPDFDNETANLALSIAESVELVILVGTVIPVEMALKHTFDENGVRRDR